MVSLGITVLLISAAVLGVELALMRALSISMWHHFAYLIISAALLGFGLSGVIISLGERFFRRHWQNSVWLTALGFAIAVPLGYWAATSVPLNVLELIWDPRQKYYLGLYYLGLLPIFLCGGGCVGLALLGKTEKAGSLYGLNLLGSGLGAAGSVALMYGQSPTQVLMQMCVLGFGAALAAAIGKGIGRIVITFLIGVVTISIFSLYRPLPLPISQYKSLSFYEGVEDFELLARRYSPLGRIDLVRSKIIRHFPGLSLNFPENAIEKKPSQAALTWDGDGTSAVNRFDKLDELACYDWMSSALAYQLVDRPRVLVVGAGGGSDVAQALYEGAREVAALELNAQVIDLLSGEFADLAGEIYQRDDVRLIKAEGRHFLEQTAESFDVIQIALLESQAAGAAGVYSLNENQLYTVEGIERALSRLGPSGVLSITRWLKAPPRDAIKMLATVVEALEQRGISEPSEHIAMIRSIQTATIVVRNESFRESEINKVREFAQQRGFDLVHVPGIKANEVNQYHKLSNPDGPYYTAAKEILSPRAEKFFGDYVYNVRPATDDRPYFYNFFRWRSLGQLRRTLGRDWLSFTESGYLIMAVGLVQVIVLSVALLIVPGLMVRKRVKNQHGRLWCAAGYFLALGFGFIFIEMGFIQKLSLLLGNPIYAVAVVVTGFLCFSGIGSMAAGWLANRYRAAAVVSWAIMGIVCWAIVLTGILHWCSGWLIGLSGPLRIGLIMVLIGPLAFCMGFCFPTGLRIASKSSGSLVPWAWAVNGFGSVTGAVAATLLAVSIGFIWLIVAALGMYVAASYLIGRLVKAA